MKIEQIQEHLLKYKIGIAGAGGLGSNCAVSLVRAGIKKMLIADFDVVQVSNLNRQYYFLDQLGQKKVNALGSNLNRIANNLELELIDKKLVASDVATLFANCDVIVEAFDDKAEKKMLIETVLEVFPEKPLVIGSGMAGWGMNHLLKTEQMDAMYICGDGFSEISENLPPLGPRVGIVANMQANVVLELILGKMR